MIYLSVNMKNQLYSPVLYMSVRACVSFGLAYIANGILPSMVATEEKQ